MKKKLHFRVQGVLSTLPLENIVSRYKFENDTLDAVGSNDGTPTDISYVSGLVGQAGEFNGSTSFVDLGNSINSTFEGIPFSISLLLNTSLFAGTMFLVSNDESTNPRGFQFRVEGGQVRFLTIDGGVSTLIAGHSMITGTWYHLTATHDGGDGSNMKVYLDGVNITTSTQSNSSGMGQINHPLVIGYNARSNNFYYNGKLDEVIIWDKELSGAEALDLATQQLAGIDIEP